MAKPTRWGIIGSGNICHDFVMCIQMQSKEEHEVVAVVDRRLEDAQTFAEKFVIPKVHTTIEEFAKDPKIEIAYIGTIHPCHHGQAKLMLNSGKHVLCEKPMTLNYKNTKELTDLAQEKNLFLMEGLWSRFFPVYVKMREALAAGTIGEPLYLSTHFGYPLQYLQRFVQHKLGGGAVVDLGLYGVSMALQVFNEEPERIVASAVMQNDVDLASAVTLYFKNKRVAQINCHAGVMTNNNTYIAGDKGNIEVVQMWCPTQITINGVTHDYPLPKAPLETSYPNGQGMIYEVKTVRECLLKGLKENPLAPHSDTLRIIKILDEARRQIGLVYDADI